MVAIIEPDAMADDFAGKAVIFVALGVSGWRHVWLPIGVCEWFLRGDCSAGLLFILKELAFSGFLGKE